MTNPDGSDPRRGPRRYGPSAGRPLPVTSGQDAQPRRPSRPPAYPPRQPLSRRPAPAPVPARPEPHYPGASPNPPYQPRPAAPRSRRGPRPTRRPRSSRPTRTRHQPVGRSRRPTAVPAAGAGTAAYGGARRLVAARQAAGHPAHRSGRPDPAPRGAGESPAPCWRPGSSRRAGSARPARSRRRLGLHRRPAVEQRHLRRGRQRRRRRGHLRRRPDHPAGRLRRQDRRRRQPAERGGTRPGRHRGRRRRHQHRHDHAGAHPAGRRQGDRGVAAPGHLDRPEGDEPGRRPVRGRHARATYNPNKINSYYATAKAYTEEHLVSQGVTDKAQIERESNEAGRTMLIRVVQAFTGMKIDHYAEVNLLGFYLLSNAIGGVPVCLNAAVDDPWSGADFPAGPQEVQGTAALAFVRQRHGLPGGDLDRVRRQQAFLSGAADKILSVGTLTNPSKLNDLVGAIDRSVVFDKDFSVLTFAEQITNLSSGNINFETLPTDGTGVLDRQGRAGHRSRPRSRPSSPAITGGTAATTPAAPGTGRPGVDHRRHAGRHHRRRRHLVRRRDVDNGRFKLGRWASSPAPSRATSSRPPRCTTRPARRARRSRSAPPSESASSSRTTRSRAATCCGRSAPTWTRPARRHRRRRRPPRRRPRATPRRRRPTAGRASPAASVPCVN